SVSTSVSVSVSGTAAWQPASRNRTVRVRIDPPSPAYARCAPSSTVRLDSGGRPSPGGDDTGTTTSASRGRRLEREVHGDLEWRDILDRAVDRSELDRPMLQ